MLIKEYKGDFYQKDAVCYDCIFIGTLAMNIPTKLNFSVKFISMKLKHYINAESAWISAYEEDLMQYLQLVLINLFLTN